MEIPPDFTSPRTEITDEERAVMEAWIAAHPYGEQDENGIDLSLLRENLKLTPTERLQRLQSAIDALWSLRRARDEAQPSACASR